MNIIAGLVLALVTSASLSAQPIEHQITVKGEGWTRVAPDFVAIEISVTAEGQDTARIKQEVDEKTQRLLEAAAKFQIAAKDVKSGGMHIGREYETDRNDNDVFKGYAVGRTLEIRLRKIENYEALAQELVAAGMDQVDDVQVGVDDESKLRNPALAAAAKDARTKAQAVADSLGIRIGLPIEVGEDRLWYDKNLVQIAQGDGRGEIVVTGSRVKGQVLPLMFTPRDVEVEANVWVRFAIEPAK